MSARKLFFNICVVLFNMMIISAMLIGNLAFPTSAHALGLAITVNTVADNTTKDGLCTLREAITNANKNYQFYTDCTGGFSDDGIFFSDSIGRATIGLNSSLPAIKDFVGLSINGGGDITIDGFYQQVFLVNNRVPLTLDGLTVTRGGGVPKGGGLYIDGGFVTIRNSVFRSNYADNGGGIYNNAGNLNIKSSTFQGHFAGYNPGDKNGGAIYNFNGSVVIADSFFSSNGAYQNGGAIYNASGLTSITNSTFSANGNGWTGGGAVYIADGEVLITKSTFSGNSGSGGGAIGNLGAVTISNSTFSGNNGNLGGGMMNLGTATVTNSTFSGNTANAGGGIGNQGTLYLFNTIQANSISGGDCFNNNIPGSTITGHNNLIETDSLAANACDTGALAVDPRLEAPTGSPAYFPLNGSSPAVNAGDEAICAAPPVDGTSQNGVPRYQGHNAPCDIGSYELFSSSIPLPEEPIGVLSKAVSGLVDTGAISVDNGKILMSMLDASSEALDQGDITSGIKILNSFVDEVNVLIKSEEVKPADGQPWIDDAQAIIDSINQMKN